jgi:hypothetical protein
MALWSSWIPYVAVHAPGVPNLLIDQAVRRAAAEFCTVSKAYQADLDPILTVIGEPLYDVPVPAGTKLVLPARVTCESADMYPTRGDLLPAGWRASSNGTPHQYVIDALPQILVYPTPNTTNQKIYVRAVLRPSEDATEIDDAVAERYREGIAHGALQHLHMVPGKPWSDPNAAAYHRQMFHSHITAARIEADQGFGGMAQRVRMRPFA